MGPEATVSESCRGLSGAGWGREGHEHSHKTSRDQHEPGFLLGSLVPTRGPLSELLRARLQMDHS